MNNFSKFALCALLAASSFSSSAQTRYPSTLQFTQNGHVQGIGFMTAAPDTWLGTKYQSRRLEMFQVTPTYPNMGNWPSCLQLQYMAHIANFGDTAWVTAPERVGTEGQSRSLEALAMRLTGTCASNYTVEYSCHVQDMGDLGVKSNGELCGTRGMSRRLEAVMVTVRQR